MSIHVLSQDTINKIAAGEVVERPVSVIKELVENSLDAGATAVTVEIEDGGTKLIRITDNGSGIAKKDIKTAFIRHATSKIQTADDLVSINSLGFRGEALASICAVSKLECITKEADEVTGMRYVIEGGIEKEIEEIGAPNGTTFIIRDLFYNVPARKKFLKSAKTEATYVNDLVNRMALSNTGVSIRYINNKKARLHTSGNNSLKDCIYQIFGKEYAKCSKEIEYSQENINVSGVVGEAVLGRGNRKAEIYFVNGRYIKSKFIELGLERGMSARSMINQFPFCVLNIEMSGEDVDVNVHPNKMDVRFHDEELITNVIENAIFSAFESEKAKIPEISTLVEQEDEDLKKIIKEGPEPFEIKRRENFWKNLEDVVPSNDVISIKKEMSEPFEQLKEKEQIDYVIEIEEKEEAKDFFEKDNVSGINETLDAFLDVENIKKHKIIGQIFKTYWIAEYNNEIYIIDQHAAHEKVIYEELVNKVKNMGVSSQRVLTPKIYELNDLELDVWNKYKEEFLKIGYETEIFGENSIIVKSVPYILNRPMPDIDFIKLLDELVSKKTKSLAISEYGDYLATVACKAAVKGNNVLSDIEYRALIEQLLELDNPYNCPHGRPTMVRMSKSDIEKRFRRKL